MTDQHPYIVYGGLGSPYSLKVRAILRYRRVPHRWVQLTAATQDMVKRVRVPVIPVLEYPDGSFANESTQIAYDLERRHADRGILPPNPATAFLAALLEDMADEWATKLMFHYRWFYDDDARLVSLWLAYDRLGANGEAAGIDAYAAAFEARQRSRMAMVGCTPENRALIERTATELFAIFERGLRDGPYFFGTRPSLAEFAWYGQLSQLASDPTPLAVMRGTAPLLARWVAQIDDASGVDGEWDTPAPLVERLLGFAGQLYMPFLLANAAALERGEESLTVHAYGLDYRQAPFKFQAKCLADLRARYAALDAAARERIDPLLERTHCLAALRGAA